MLGFQELEQFDDFGSEMVMNLQDFARLPERHPGQEDELVSRPKGGAGFAEESTFQEHPAVDPADTRRVARDAHVTGDVLHDLRLAGDVAMASDRRELMNAHFFSDVSIRLNVDMAADHR